MKCVYESLIVICHIRATIVNGVLNGVVLLLLLLHDLLEELVVDNHATTGILGVLLLLLPGRAGSLLLCLGFGAVQIEERVVERRAQRMIDVIVALPLGLTASLVMLLDKAVLLVLLLDGRRLTSASLLNELRLLLLMLLLYHRMMLLLMILLMMVMASKGLL